MTQEMKDARNAKIDRVWEILNLWAVQYGFIVKVFENGHRELWDETRTVNFTVHEEWDDDMERRVAVTTYSVSASIATMGGNPSWEELKMRGDRITKAGQFVHTMEMQAQCNPFFLRVESEF